MCNKNLCRHTTKKAEWDDSTFLNVDWTAHAKALYCLTQFNKFSTSKLIHELIQTN